MSKEPPAPEPDDWMARRRRRAAFRSLKRLIEVSEALKNEQDAEEEEENARGSDHVPDTTESSQYRYAQRRPSLLTGC